MAEPLYPPSSRELSETRRALAPDTEKAFQAFSQKVFTDGALSAKTKQLIAVAVAHVTQCRHGVTRQESMEAIWVAAEMRAGGAYAHSTIAVTAIDEAEGLPATLGNPGTGNCATDIARRWWMRGTGLRGCRSRRRQGIWSR